MIDLLVADADDDEVADGELGVADAVVDERDRAAVPPCRLAMRLICSSIAS